VSLRFPGDPFAPRRRPTFEVRVGDVGIGGANPLRVQSMTTPDTRDVRASCDQIERLAGAGCEIVRVTAPSITEAECLAEIRAGLRRRGVRVPLVADIHFTPNAALVAAEHVEKVRINPGNYADKKKFAVREYTDAEYAAELERVAERFRPLVRRLKELGRALRIGTNHGSLSDRVMNRFGDTPLGMVESALEFLDVCEAEGFRDVVFSMKSSNPQVAIQAYRLLAAKLAQRARAASCSPRSEPQASGESTGGQQAAVAGVAPFGWGALHASYPFHLGVTEAGDGEDGRVKSAIGIGALLEDGIGDTIRVSLTEDPVKEIPVARALADRYDARWTKTPPAVSDPGAPFSEDPFAHARRASRAVPCAGIAVGGDAPVRVEVGLGVAPADPAVAARRVAGSLALAGDLACEGLLVDAGDDTELGRAGELSTRLRANGVAAPLALRVPCTLVEPAARVAARVVAMVAPSLPEPLLKQVAQACARRRVPLEWSLRAAPAQVAALLDRALDAGAAVGLGEALVSVASDLPVHAARVAAARLRARGSDLPLLLRHERVSDVPEDAALLHAASDLGAPLCDGIGDVVSLCGFGAPDRALAVAYRILQGARLRTSWTEFISCPSCGRTLFDLEETTARIKARTSHLKGVKIAIMGCIVNGPGEMADADFGYVGSGPGRVNLYVGRQCLVRNLPQEQADERLVALIREHGRWIDP
jgi:(E)-4-hydroxy-3-methylbut-2-enyl-diphosphate synthase